MPTLPLTPESVSRHWGWFVGLGIAMVALGVFALGMTVPMTVVSVVYFGVVMLIGGVLAVVHAIRERKDWGGVVLHVLIGALYLVAGGYMVAKPLAASVTLTLVVGVVLLMSGFIRVMLALFTPSLEHRALVVVSGVASIVLGLMILARWPVSGLWVIGLFVAVELIMNGWTYLVLGLAARVARPATLEKEAPHVLEPA